MDWLFLFNQTSSYEMRISIWSSDVCSSDLRAVENDPIAEVREPDHDVDRHVESRYATDQQHQRSAARLGVSRSKALAQKDWNAALRVRPGLQRRSATSHMKRSAGSLTPPGSVSRHWARKSAKAARSSCAPI